MLNKERIKSFILIVLILNSINLTVQMWFDSAIWSEDYGFKETIGNIPFIGAFFRDDENYDTEYSREQLYEMTLKPRRLVVNGGGAREVYLKESDFYNEGMQYVDVLMEGLKDKNVTVSEISYEEWKNLFKAKSVFVDYGYRMDSHSLNELYGLESSSGRFEQASNFSGYIITPDSLMNSCTVCMLNEEQNIVTEFRFQANTKKLQEFIETTTYQKQQNDAFAFEINLDVMTSEENEVERKVSFSPLTLLTIPTEFEKTKVISEKEIFGSPEDLEAFAERMLETFGYKASSLRKTVQSDGSITFVENKATIKFYYDGTIEYNAVSKENGIKISNNSSDCHQAIYDVLSITATLWAESGIEAKNLDYHLASAYMDNKENVYSVQIDNMYNGIALNHKTVTEHSVSAKVEEGYITNLVIHLSDIEETEEMQETVPVLMAIDTVYENHGNTDMIIDDVYKCYDFDKDGMGFVKWIFRVRGDESDLIVDMTDLS